MSLFLSGSGDPCSISVMDVLCASVYNISDMFSTTRKHSSSSRQHSYNLSPPSMLPVSVIGGTLVVRHPRPTRVGREIC